MSKILVTGASGFVGANLCRYFVGLGHSVIAMDSPFSAPWRLSQLPDLTHLAIDIRDRIAVTEVLFQQQPEFILHCAAYGAYPSDKKEELIYSINVDPVRHLLEATQLIPSFKGFVYAGSSSEYGLNCSGPKEEALPVPDSHYALSKLFASHLVQFYGKLKQVPAWTLRLTSVYGPYEEISRFMPQLCLKARQGRLPNLAAPNISRDFVYIDDICRAFKCVIDQCHTLPRGEWFNIGSGQCSSLQEVVALARELFHIPEEPEWGSYPDRKWDHAGWYSNPQKAAKHLGWHSTTSLESGLTKMYQWMLDNPTSLLTAEVHSIAKHPDRVIPSGLRETH